VRFIQGVGIGGEWGGATLIAMEWARTNAHRGFITSWPQWGGPAGLFLANVMVLLFSWISGDQFLDWGWRVPFWLSIVMVGIGLYIRLGILDRNFYFNETHAVDPASIIPCRRGRLLATAWSGRHRAG
jgi:MFS family permease